MDDPAHRKSVEDRRRPRGAEVGEPQHGPDLSDAGGAGCPLAVPVVITSELYGDSPAIARRVTAREVVVEMAFPVPLEHVVTVRFRYLRADGYDELAARAVVRRVYVINAAESCCRRLGLAVIDYDDQVPVEPMLGEGRDQLH